MRKTDPDTFEVKERRKKNKKIRGKTVSVIVVGFLVLIAVGTLFLWLPISSADGKFTPVLDSLFTATSASCVTGLTVVTTAEHWNMFGKSVILLLIQIGGLGFMTMAVLASQIIRRAVTPRDQMLVAMSYNLDSYDSVRVLVKRIVGGTFLFELVGAGILLTQFAQDYSFGKAVYMSVFTSISAFCNAGFDLVGASSVAPYAGNAAVMITLTLLIGIGGIGFVVWNDIINRITSKKRMSVYSKFVMLVSLVLFIGGALIFALLEWNNSSTIGDFPVFQKIYDSFFQSMTYRTAGFAIFDNAGLTNGGKLMGLIWMFVGGASGSTAGGVKVATVGILFYTVWCIAFDRRDTVVFGRKIPRDAFERAVAVVIVQISLIFVSTILLCSVENTDVMSGMFETVSAISTVGLSLGVTPTLGVFGKILIAALMYFGRVGVLSVTYAVMVNMSGDGPDMTYPDANMLIG